MSRTFQGLGFAAMLALMFNAGAVHAQAAAQTTTKPTIPLRYDISKEVTLNATVESVPSKSSAGLLHSGSSAGFVLQTSFGAGAGAIDPIRSKWKRRDFHLSLARTIQVTGVMMTMKNDKQVFVIRTITVGGRTYAIRNERGFPLEHPGQNRLRDNRVERRAAMNRKSLWIFLLALGMTYVIWLRRLEQ